MPETYLVNAGLVAVLVVALTLYLNRSGRKAAVPPKRARATMGNALLGLRELIEPSVEQIVAAQNGEQRKADDDHGQGGDAETIRADLADALSQTPVDLEEVRRHLRSASVLGIDWKSLFDQAVADELRQRPYRLPSVPPSWRVAPRE